MTDNLKDFLEYVSKDEELTKKANLLNEQCHDKKELADTVIAFAKENGFTLTRDDFKEETQELSDDELENVAGGDTCGCFLGGGGGAAAHEGVCACIAAGFGLKDKNGGGYDYRCICGVGGGGTDNIICG